MLGSPSWINRRRSIALQFMNWYNIGNNPSSSLPYLLPTCNQSLSSYNRQEALKRDNKSIHHQHAKLTIGILTCKRISKFLETAKALFKAFGNIPNKFIADILVVDDGSSVEDRLKMLQEFPEFTFIFKSENERGHANSFNKLIKMIKTRYFIYLEDDWVIQDLISHQTNPLTEVIQQLHQVYESSSDNQSDTVVSTFISHLPYYSIFMTCLSILGFEGSIDFNDLDSHTNRLVFHIQRRSTADDNSKYEKVHQILFNEQSSRSCAQIRPDCDVNTIGKGGWSRYLQISMDSNNVSASFNLPYAIHEFGLISGINLYQDRIHDYSYWPGVNFNPGIWDLSAIRAEMALCQDTRNMKYVDDEFEDGNTAFEHTYTALGLAAGLTMAYLPLLLFKHIGDDISAYDLNNVERPYKNITESYKSKN